MRRVFYVDPMSYHNMAVYDYNLLKDCLDFEVFYFCNEKYSFKALQSSNIRVFPIFAYSDKRLPGKGISYVLSIFRVFIRVLVDKPTALHIQWIRFWPVDYAILKLLRLCAPQLNILYTAHEVLPYSSEEKDLLRLSKYYKSVDWVICHTISTKREIEESLEVDQEKIVVIPHGLLDYHFSEDEIAAEKNAIQERFSLRGKTIVSFLGVQSPYKGVDLLVQAWASSERLSESKDTCLIISGENKGCDYSCVSSLSNVRTEDRRLSDREFVAFMRLTDVLVLPYRKISQSGVLLSAINERTPFLVSNAGELAKPLESARVGWRLGEPTIENLRASLESILAGREFEKMKKNESEWSHLQSKYSWRSIAAKTFDLYTTPRRPLERKLSPEIKDP